MENQPAPKHAAKLYMLKIMQSQAFDKEISYLKDLVNKEISILVRNFNIFKNSEGIELMTEFLNHQDIVIKKKIFILGQVYPID